MANPEDDAAAKKQGGKPKLPALLLSLKMQQAIYAVIGDAPDDVAHAALRHLGQTIDTACRALEEGVYGK